MLSCMMSTVGPISGRDEWSGQAVHFVFFFFRSLLGTEPRDAASLPYLYVSALGVFVKYMVQKETSWARAEDERCSHL